MKNSADNLAHMMSKSSCMTVLNLSANNIGRYKDTDSLAIVLVTSPKLTTLDLSINGMRTSGAEILAVLLRHPCQLAYLNVRRNFFCVDGAMMLLRVLEEGALPRQHVHDTPQS
jgi:hypothetical protein